MPFKWLFTIEFIYITYLNASKDIPNIRRRKTIDDMTKVEEKTKGKRNRVCFYVQINVSTDMFVDPTNWIKVELTFLVEILA